MKRFRYDILLIAGAIVVSGLAWLLLTLLPAKGGLVIVEQDGEITAEYPLSENTDVLLSTPYGENRLVITDGAASVTEADCPDKLCVRQHNIQKNGQTIVCLPHKLVIHITSNAQPEVDVIT